jgi:hypothetical protein
MSFPLIVVNDIPHLGFPNGVVKCFGQRIVGVYLDGKIVASVNELDKEREVIAETFVVFFSQQGSFVFLDQLAECLACIRSGRYNGFVVGNVGYFPAFPYSWLADMA